MSTVRGYEENQLTGRLKWLMFFRLAFAVSAIVSVLLIESDALRRPVRGWKEPTYATLIFACGVNLLYLVAFRIGARARPMAVAQLMGDVLIVSALVYFSGIERWFSLLYFSTVLAGALLLRPRAGFVFASVSTILLAAISTAYFLAARAGGGLPYADPTVIAGYDTRLSFLLPYLFFFGVSLHVVAFLSSLLAREVSRVRILNEEILQGMAGGVLAVDRYGAIAFVNEQAVQLLGLEGGGGAVRGRNYAEVLPVPVAVIIERALRAGTRTDRVVPMKGGDLQVMASHLMDGPGRLRGVIAILNDLAPHRQAEEMTRRAERFQSLIEMSAGMAHEIRNPLASIRGAAQELVGSAAATDDDRRLLRVIQGESDRLNQIIGDFLEYASDKPVHVTTVLADRLLEETVVLLETRPEAERVSIVRDWPVGLSCQGDVDKIKQVLLNLGLNALEALQGKGSRLTVRAAAASHPADERREGVVIEFEDDGPGIPREMIPRVFHPFVTSKPRGTGMGLAVARKIVQAHQGEITVDSDGERGTRVRIWLPA